LDRLLVVLETVVVAGLTILLEAASPLL